MLGATAGHSPWPGVVECYGVAREHLLEIRTYVVGIDRLFGTAVRIVDVGFLKHEQRVTRIYGIACTRMDAPHDTGHLGTHFVLHLHGLHHRHAAPGGNRIAFHHVDGHHRALQGRSHQCLAFFGGRPVGGRRCGSGFAAKGKNRQRIAGVDLGACSRRRNRARVCRGDVQQGTLVEVQGPLGCEPGGEKAILERWMIENRPQVGDVRVHALDAELPERSTELCRDRTKRCTGRGHHFGKQRVVAWVGLVAGIAEGVGAQARPGRRIEGGKHASGRQCVAAFGHPFHVDPRLDGKPC